MKQLVLLALVCWASINAQDEDIEAYAAEDYPNPLLDPDMCGRGSDKSYICDPSYMLTSNEAKQLEALLGIIRNETACPCADNYCTKTSPGYKIGIALVKMITPSQSAKTSEKEDDPAFVINRSLHESRYFSYVLLKRWQMGTCGEDVIILYSPVDNVFYTITGAVAAKKLTASIIGDIAMNTRNMFTPEYLFEGLLSLVKQYQAVFLDRYEPPAYKVKLPTPQAVRSNTAGFLLPSLLSLFLGLLVAVH